MKIGELSKKYEISIDTLRFYDRIGLLVPERLNSIREYTTKESEKLEIILLLKKLSFTLDEIEEIIQIDEEIDQSIDKKLFDQERAGHLIMILKKKYQQFEMKEEEIKKAKVHLTHLLEKIKFYQTNKSSKKQVENERIRYSNLPNRVWML